MTLPSYLTKEGAEKLRAELAHLEGPVRLELSKRLRSAIQMGDLSENADYIAAKEDQAFIEGRIQQLTKILHDVVIIDESALAKDVIDIGSTVTIQEGKEPEETYMLVGPEEADPKNGRISYSSPIGQAVMGHRVGDKVTAQSPGGEIHFRILKIE